MSERVVVTRRDYLIASFAESVALTGRVLSPRIAAIATLLSGIGALVIGTTVGFVQLGAFLAYVVLVAVFGVWRLREARNTFPRLRALARASDFPADPQDTLDLPIFMLTPEDISDPDMLDRRLKLRPADRAAAVAADRSGNIGVVLYLVLLAASAVLLLALVRSVDSASDDGLVLYSIAVVSPIVLLLVDYIRYLDYARNEEAESFAAAKKRLPFLSIGSSPYVHGAVVKWDAEGYRVDESGRVLRRYVIATITVLRSVLLVAAVLIALLYAASYLYDTYAS